MSQYYQIRIDMSKDQGDLINEYCKKLKISQYCISFEVADVTGKEHWQGWAEIGEDDIKPNTFQKSFKEWCRKHNLSKSQYCFAKIDDYLIYQSYILKNDTKRVTKVYSKLDINMDNIPQWVEHRDTKKPKDTWEERTFQRLVEEVIVDEQYIDYTKMCDVVLKCTPKKLDKNFFKQYLLSLGNRLEQAYPDGFNKRIQTYLKSQIKVDPEMDGIFNRQNLGVQNNNVNDLEDCI